jgi:L-ascorbate metabolism protein UlaG (beta-lactamase superfamily)
MAVSRITRVLRAVVAVPVLLATLLVAAFFVYARHVPWAVPDAHRPPPTWTQPQDGGLTLRFLGVSGYEVSDGVTTILLDPTPTRPPPGALLTGPVDADEALGAQWCPKADAILVNHAHYDHALDVPAIAKRTGALVVGTQSAVNLALARGVPAAQTRVVELGDRFTVGTFTIDVRASRHTDIAGIREPMGGIISPDAGPLWFWEYVMDGTRAYRLEAGGASVWFHPTSTFERGEVGTPPADTLIVGVTGEKQTAEKVKGLLAEARPRRVLPTHYDNFFQPVQKGLALMPGLDLDAAKRLFLEADPSLEWGVLDLGQRVWLPPDEP